MGVHSPTQFPALDEAPPQTYGALSPAAERLKIYLEANLEALVPQIAALVSRMDWGATPVDPMEVVSKTIAEVWRKADEFDETRAPRAWVMRFAANILKQQRERLSTRQKYETRLERQGISFEAETVEAIDMLDRLAAQNPRSLEDVLTNRDSLQRALADLSIAEREIIWLAHVHDMQGPEIAQKLGIQPAAARARLARAMEHFRIVYFNQIGGSEK